MDENSDLDSEGTSYALVRISESGFLFKNTLCCLVSMQKPLTINFDTSHTHWFTMYLQTIANIGPLNLGFIEFYSFDNDLMIFCISGITLTK